jgi:DNA-binding XRE family transcriptional regulator
VSRFCYKHHPKQGIAFLIILCIFIPEEETIHKNAMNTTTEELEKIRERIKKIRFEKGLTQDNMASMLNISQNAYHKLENGHSKMNLSKFIDICKVLEIEMAEIINGPERTYTFSKYYKKPLVKVY